MNYPTMIDISRQEKSILNEYGVKIDKKNYDKKILLVGCGGVGSPLAELLVRGGFSNLVLVDFDIVDKTNIQRQNYVEQDIGESKVESLKKRLLKINPKCKIDICAEKFDRNSKKELFTEVEIILDGTDNVTTRYDIDYFSKKYNIFWIYNGAIKTQSISCLLSPENQNLSKIIPKDFQEQGCEDGVLGSTTYITASLCYNILLKYFIGHRENKLYKFDMIKNLYLDINI